MDRKGVGRSGGRRIAGQGRGAVAAVAVTLAALFSSPHAAAQPGAPAAKRPAAQPLAPPGEAPLDTPEGTLGYALGLRIGSQIAADFRAQKAPFDFSALAQGLSDAVRGTPPRLPDEQLTAALQAFEARMQQERESFRQQMVEKGKANRAKAAQFLAANKGKKGIVTLPSGLQYEVLQAGDGPKPKPTDVVSTHYRGTHLDGKQFDASDPAQGPLRFPVQQVIPGWQEALALMPVGSKWRLWVPPDLGYGDEGSPPVIEPGEVLVFEMELLGIEAAK
ncbi:MAG: FKBP-type peptidyl-prolyl cis-trans isomerase [Planctomycetia bacterium]